MQKSVVIVLMMTLSSIASAAEWVVTKDTEVKVFSFDLNAEPKFCVVRKGGVLYSTSNATQILRYAPKGRPGPGECSPREPNLVVFPEDLRYFTVPR